MNYKIIGILTFAMLLGGAVVPALSGEYILDITFLGDSIGSIGGVAGGENVYYTISHSFKQEDLGLSKYYFTDDSGNLLEGDLLNIPTDAEPIAYYENVVNGTIRIRMKLNESNDNYLKEEALLIRGENGNAIPITNDGVWNNICTSCNGNYTFYLASRFKDIVWDGSKLFKKYQIEP